MTIASLSNSSWLQQLQQRMFTQADTNGDGQLSVAEFESIGQNLQGGGNSSASAGSSPETDPSGGMAMAALSLAQGFASDTLSALLSLQDQSQGGAQTGGVQSGGTPAHGSRLAQMFQSADTDGDGKLTADELTAAIEKNSPQGSPTADPTKAAAVANTMLAAADKNGDGSLSLDEFKSAMRSAHGHHHHHHHGGSGGAGQASASDPADLNGDGKVSADERATVLQSAQQNAGTGLTDPTTSDLMTKLLTQLQGAAATGVAVNQAA